MNQKELERILTARGVRASVKAYGSLRLLHDERSGRYLLVERYGPDELWWSEAWRAFHLPRTSTIVDDATVIGNRTLIFLREGAGDLDLVPSLSPIGIESLEIDDEAAHVTYAGLGGGGVSASYGRGLAQGVDEIEIHEHGGGERLGKATLRLSPIDRLLLIAVDDTDTEREGATYATVANIAQEVSQKIPGVAWVVNVEVNLFPPNPHKTSNGFASLAGFRIPPRRKRKVINFFASRLREASRSDHTAMCAYEGFDLPGRLFGFANQAQSSLIDSVDAALEVAETCHVDVIPITGERGAIGAIAALGFWNRPQEAVDISTFLERSPRLEENTGLQR